MVGDVDVKASLRNVGTVHRDFRGTTPLTVTGGGATSEFGDFSIPRGSPRVVSTEWKPPLVCICHPTVSFNNAKGAVQSAGFRVIIFPWWLAAAIVLIGLGAASRGWYRRHQHRKSLGIPLTGTPAVSSGGV
jgi:hypothetical protein